MLNTVIVGAGPYGLSIAAHLRHYGIPFRIFGRPMDSWRAHMPKGMFLKSDGFASNISDPVGALSLEFGRSKLITLAAPPISFNLNRLTIWQGGQRQLRAFSSFFPEGRDIISILPCFCSPQHFLRVV